MLVKDKERTLRGSAGISLHHLNVDDQVREIRGDLHSVLYNQFIILLELIRIGNYIDQASMH